MGIEVLKYFDPRRLLESKPQLIAQGQVRSVTSKVNTYRTAQNRPLYVRDLYGVYPKNYVVRTCVDAKTEDLANRGHEWIRDESVPLTPEQEELKEYADKLISQPNPQMTEYDFITAIGKDLLLGADSFVEIVNDTLILTDPVTGKQTKIGKRPSELWPVEGFNMSIIPLDETGALPSPPANAYQQQKRGGGTLHFATDEMIHFSEGDVAGRLYGTPRLLSAIVLIATQNMAMVYNLKTFTGQKYPKSLVGVGQLGDGNDLDRLVANAEKQAAENPNGIMFLDTNVLTLLKLIDSNRDMEFMDMVKYIERCICAVYRVPQIRIGISEAGGAGIVVGQTQMSTYWDDEESLQGKITSKLNQFFKQQLGLTAYKYKLRSGRPTLYSDEAQVEDVRVKNGTLTINEARKFHGLQPVVWGDEPPQAPAPPAFTLPPGENLPALPPASALMFRGLNASKSVAPGRMDDSSPLVDPVIQRVYQRTRSNLAGSWMTAKKEILELLHSAQVLKAEAKPTTREQLAWLIDQALARWVGSAEDMMRTGTADSYADSRQAMLRDLEMENTLSVFSPNDANNLQFIYRAYAEHPITTFKGEQQELIEQAIADAYTTGEGQNLYDIRAKVEQDWMQMGREETWKLDRIVRTSTHQAGCKARGQAFRDSGLQEVRLFTANDGNVRPSHKQYHGQVIPLAQAEAILMDINCRCRMTKAARHPSTVPSPDALADAIGKENMDARQQAYAALQEAA